MLLSRSPNLRVPVRCGTFRPHRPRPTRVVARYIAQRTVSRNSKLTPQRSKVAASRSLPIVGAAMETVPVKIVQTKPIDGQKTGTSGLRKQTSVFMSENYLANWIQSLFNALGDELKGKTIALGGDGRYFNKEATQIILKLAAGNGVKSVIVGQDAFLCTPAMSALIRERELYGGLIMSASHNPGGPDGDFGIKFNYMSGEPAPERITNKIYAETQKVTELKFGDIPDTDLSDVGAHIYGDFEVDIVSATDDYFNVLQRVFDFDMLKAFLARSDFKMVFDAMHAVTGAYAKPLFVDLLGAPESCIINGLAFVLGFYDNAISCFRRSERRFCRRSSGSKFDVCQRACGIDVVLERAEFWSGIGWRRR